MTTNPWLRIGVNALWLTVAASSVIALRAIVLAKGGAPARKEGRRMVSEKIAAALTLVPKLASSRSAPEAVATTLKHYRRKVRANRKRLTKQ